MSLLSTYINPNLSGLATTESVAAAQAAIDALVEADKQAVIDAIAGLSSANMATLLAAIAAVPSTDLQPVLDAIGALPAPATGFATPGDVAEAADAVVAALPSVAGLATTEQLADAKFDIVTAVEAIPAVDLQPVLDAISALPSPAVNFATPEDVTDAADAVVAALPSIAALATTAQLADAQAAVVADIVDAVQALPTAGLPSGAVIKVAGNAPLPAGYSFLDSQISGAVAQGCHFSDSKTHFGCTRNLGLMVIDQAGTNSSLNLSNYSFASTLIDPTFGDVSDYNLNYDLTGSATSAELIAAHFVPGTPSRLYIVAHVVSEFDSMPKASCMSFLPNESTTSFEIESNVELDLASAGGVEFSTVWGSNVQSVIEVPSTAAPGATVFAVRLGGAQLASWLLWDPGENPEFRITAGDGFLTADSRRMLSSVGRVLASSGDTLLCVGTFDDFVRTRAGVYYDATNDIMCAAASSLVVGVPQRAFAVTTVDPLAGQETRFLAYTRLGFLEISHGEVTGTSAPISVRQTSGRHPLDDFESAPVGLLNDGSDTWQVAYNIGGTAGKLLSINYPALQAGFERKAVKD